MSETKIQIDRFAVSARQFVAWCEVPQGPQAPESFKWIALKQLADIYQAGFLIPEVEFEDAPDLPRVSAEELKNVAQNLQALPFQYYWTVFTPSDLEGDREPVCGDLFDDFQDIYADLRNGLSQYDAGYINSAAHEWRMFFRIHWGRHAVEAMQALHAYEVK